MDQEELTREKRRTHRPLISNRCDGIYCRRCPTLWKYLITGMELRGAGDNATWLHDATTDHRGKPTEKLTRARWRRVTRRHLLLTLPLAQLMATPWIGRGPLIAYVVATLIAGLALAARKMQQTLPHHGVRKRYVYPAGRTLAALCDVRFRRKEAVGWIQLPEGFGQALDERETPAPVRVHIPGAPVLDDKKRTRIASEVGARLGMPRATARWTIAGVEHPYVELLPAALPPTSVTLDDLMADILASPLEQPVLGMAEGRKVSRLDFVNDSPHTLGSAASGAGKSTLYKLIAMQRMRKGAYAIILDFKKWSHLRWAGRLPDGRVLIAHQIPEIHDILVRVCDELIWRKSHDLDQEKELAALPTIDVYMEELGSLRELLAEHWARQVQLRKVSAARRIRTAKAVIRAAGGEAEATEEMLAELEAGEDERAAAMALPKTSPAIQALKFGVNLGREFKIHFHFISQSIDATVAGGRNVRASFRTRLLARWDEKDWKMLAPGIPFVACPSGRVGIWAHVHGSEYEIVRVPKVSDEAAVDFVMAGDRPALPMFHGDKTSTIEGQATDSAADNHNVQGQPRQAIAAPVPLSEAVRALPGMSGDNATDVARVRQWRQRDRSFPEPVAKSGAAHLYDLDELVQWCQDRRHT